MIYIYVICSFCNRLEKTKFLCTCCTNFVVSCDAMYALHRFWVGILSVPGLSIPTFIFMLFAITAAVFVPCGGHKTSPRTSFILQIIFPFWSLGISEDIQKSETYYRFSFVFLPTFNLLRYDWIILSTSRQRSRKGAIRKTLPLQTPRWKKA